jgi:Uncharacterized conserved protein
MCLLLFAYQAHPGYRLVLGANRDEFYDRPTAPAAFWDDAPWILGGRDLSAGGTWLAISKDGRFGAVTNIRAPGSHHDNAPSRGWLIRDYLCGESAAAAYLDELQVRAGTFNGFNLILGDASGIYYFSSRGGKPQRVSPGLHGLSNHLLDTPWPKVVRGKCALGRVLRTTVLRTAVLRTAVLHTARDISIDAVLALLTDSTHPDDRALPDTGVGLTLERFLSPLFIVGAHYGTRASSVILIDQLGTVQFCERTFGSNSEVLGERHFRFELEGRASQWAAPCKGCTLQGLHPARAAPCKGCTLQGLHPARDVMTCRRSSGS